MLQRDEVSLIAWPDGPDGGPRLLGRTDDPEVVEFVRERIAAEGRAALDRLAPIASEDVGLRAVPDGEGFGSTDSRTSRPEGES